MKNTLKAWIKNNTVTSDDKEDKILTVESAGSLTLDDVFDEMVREDTGLRRETMVHSINLYNNTLSRLVLNGYTINTGLFYMSPLFRGIITDGVWDDKVNSIYINFQQGKLLREGSAKTLVKILGTKQNSAYIIGSEDTTTRATDGTATPGRTFRIRGKKIRIAGDDPTVGVYIIDSDNNETKLSNDMIVLNNPSDLIVLLPADLSKGTYEMRLVTQFCSSSAMLKTPRQLIKKFTIGTSGEVEDPTA